MIVIGDSNTIFWKNFDSALPQILAFELGFPVDAFSINGGGANATRINLVRRIRSDPGVSRRQKGGDLVFYGPCIHQRPAGLDSHAGGMSLFLKH